MKIKDYLIKKLGGFTFNEYDMLYKGYRRVSDRSKDQGVKIRKGEENIRKLLSERDKLKSN